MGFHPHGYTPFYYDLTPHLNSSGTLLAPESHFRSGLSNRGKANLKKIAKEDLAEKDAPEAGLAITR